MNTKRKREQLLRLRSPRYRQTPLHLKRVKLTPSGVNHLLSLGAQFTNLANLGEQESKRTLQRICLFLFISAHRQFGFKGYTITYF